MKIEKTIEKKLIKAALEGIKNAFTGTNKPKDMRFGVPITTFEVE